MKKTWKIKNTNKKLNIKEIVKALLYNRGLTTQKQIELFLNPPDPYELTYQSLGMEQRQILKSLKRIKKAIRTKEDIIIYGDYDADGVSATAIMWETLHALGAKVMPFIPNREELGYGLKKEGIEEILATTQDKPGLKKNNKPGLIITVDNGIVAHKGVSYANKLGIDVIITDHHQKKQSAISNPRPRLGLAEGGQQLAKGNKQKVISNKQAKFDLPKAYSIIWSDKVCGAGVAWFLAKEIYHHFHHNLLGFKQSNALELACIGTITDLMPVLEFNRSIIKYGLQELQRSQRLGIMALCQEIGVPQKEISTFEIGYIIGPRLNAMGRLENALESLRLLCTKDHHKANKLALKLGLTNRRRQELTMETYEIARLEVIRQLAEQNSRQGRGSPRAAKVIIISDKRFSQGVIGLVASKLVEEFYRPAVVLSQGKEYSKASARSVKGFNIIKALRQFENLYEDIGGHPMAAGFTIATSKIKNFKIKIKNLLAKKIPADLLKPTIAADLEINLNDIDWELADELEKLAPFGMGNPTPTFIVSGVKILNIRTVGRENKHLKLQIQSPINNETIYDAIAFNLGHLAHKIKSSQPIDILFTIEKNIWNGNENLQLKIKDIKIN